MDERKHIMVVDDDSDDRAIFCRTLEAKHPEVDCIQADNGLDALTYLRDPGNPRPDVIFLDINMPVMTGWEFLSKIKSEEALKNIPVIMFSTSSHARDVEIAYDLGAVSYCVKPDVPSMLEKIISYVVNRLGSDLQSLFPADLYPYLRARVPH